MSDLVVVTGALGALGTALCPRLEMAGYGLLMLDSSTQLPETWPAALETQRCVLGVDLRDAAQAQAAISAALEELGGAYALVNLAGGFVWETVADGRVDTWQQMFDANVKTAVNSIHAVLPHLKTRKRGRIVNVGANAALKPASGMGAYAAAKSGVHALTVSLADELKAHNIQVNAVLPGILDTPANRCAMPDADAAQWVTPDSLCKVIAFLLSSGAADVTGACLPVTGRL